jgi:hypothetical protein
MHPIQVNYKDKSSDIEHLNTVPDKCPICHHSISPEFHVAYYSTHDIPSTGIDVVWRCPSKQCNRLFISYYENKIFKYSTPNLPENVIVEENISIFSQRFSTIYTQALAAKEYGLNELVGIGLRKALEILIKDYCIYKNAAEIEKIKKNTLNDCINQYCESYVQRSAHKCRVLGNDETHYERKYEERDINDLEKLLKITLYWINAEFLLDSYEDIPSSKN